MQLFSRATLPLQWVPPTMTLTASVLRHDVGYGLTTLSFGEGKLRVPIVDAPVGATVRVAIDPCDVAIALSRPVDVSITNRVLGTIIAIEYLALPYACVTLDLGSTRLDSLVTVESVERLGLEIGLKAWAMIKTIAVGKGGVRPADPPAPRRRTVIRRPGRVQS